MTTSTGDMKGTRAQDEGRSRWRTYRPVAGTLGTYGLLIGVGLVFAFPFIFLITTSLKTSEEVFQYPPQLLPMQATTASFEGSELPLFRIPVDGGTEEMVPAESGIRAGVFVATEVLHAIHHLGCAPSVNVILSGKSVARRARAKDLAPRLSDPFRRFFGRSVRRWRTPLLRMTVIIAP